MATAMSPERRVLGDVSPNIRMGNGTTGTPLKGHKPVMGSPLKRTFTAMAEDNAGLTYLKRRRTSINGFTESGDQVVQHPRRSVFKTVSPREPAAEVPSLLPSAMHEEDLPTVPTIHEPSPTEPNTPSDDGEPNSSSSADRKSFSSLINYDPSSQQQPPITSSTTATTPTKLPSQAEMLRLRLRVAMYKVRTNQLDVPFEELRVETRRTPRTMTAIAVEEAVAQLRAEAAAAAAKEAASLPAKPTPTLLPAPILKPTAYSSRMIYETAIPSSPPASHSEEELDEDSREVATPRQYGWRVGSPPDTLARMRMRAVEEENLTSSVVKGRVAEGLLGLRNAV